MSFQEVVAPYIVHSLAPLNLSKQISKKGDFRQMGPWQRIGVYAAGLALESAGLKDQAEILQRMDMTVAAGGGERDVALDESILVGSCNATAPATYINERLMNDLRPSLFLSQLSNLLAGNVSIVHGVVGSSRTFMGEESAGVDAAHSALSRIVAGQSDIALVGGSQNSERKDSLLLYEFGDFNLKAEFSPVWERAPRGGFALGSMGAFLVLEAKEHAQARAAIPYARLSAVVSERSCRMPGEVKANLESMYQELMNGFGGDGCAVISGATRAEPATAEERQFIQRHPELAARATGTYLGHGVEPQFLINLALGAMALRRGSLFHPLDQSGVELPMTEPLIRTIVTSVGHWRGQGMALLERVSSPDALAS